MTRRYQTIGGSPLASITQLQAKALHDATRLPALVGMRFGEPRVDRALRAAVQIGLRRLVVLPIAPYSVKLYWREVEQRLAELQLTDAGTKLEIVTVADWGQHPRLVRAHAASINARLVQATSEQAPIIVTAHSLPMQAINAGDTYASLVEASAVALQRELGKKVLLAYQSQGNLDGEWLGPSLNQMLQSLANIGHREVIVSPIGFLSEHVETLYDLDHEACAYAQALGVTILRVPALNAAPELILCMKDLVDAALMR